MPALIGRDEALARLVDHGMDCLCCALLADMAGPRRTVASSELAEVVLTDLPVRWGHAMVVVRQHLTNFSDLPPALWADACELARRTAVALESVLKPARCYVASLGTADPEVPQSCGHLHLHVIPVDDASLRPRQVLTWQHGVYSATEAEWNELTDALRTALAR